MVGPLRTKIKYEESTRATNLTVFYPLFLLILSCYRIPDPENKPNRLTWPYFENCYINLLLATSIYNLPSQIEKRPEVCVSVLKILEIALSLFGKLVTNG